MSERLARKLVVPVLLTLALAGCERPTPATPPVSLPTLTRPRLALHADSRASNIKVPAPAVVMRGGVPGVFVLEDGRARFRMVKTGNKSGQQVEILSGLRGDETLVVGDLTGVHDGSPVAPTKGGS